MPDLVVTHVRRGTVVVAVDAHAREQLRDGGARRRRGGELGPRDGVVPTDSGCGTARRRDPGTAASRGRGDRRRRCSATPGRRRSSPWCRTCGTVTLRFRSRLRHLGHGPAGSVTRSSAASVSPVRRSTSIRNRRPRLSTSSEPPLAIAAPVTTRRPLPTAPRVGRRSSLELVSGRSTANRVAIAAASRPCAVVGHGPGVGVDLLQGRVRAGVEGVVDQLLQGDGPHLPGVAAGLLRQPGRVEEQRPVGPREQHRPGGLGRELLLRAGGGGRARRSSWPQRLPKLLPSPARQPGAARGDGVERPAVELQHRLRARPRLGVLDALA